MCLYLTAKFVDSNVQLFDKYCIIVTLVCRHTQVMYKLINQLLYLIWSQLHMLLFEPWQFQKGKFM